MTEPTHQISAALDAVTSLTEVERNRVIRLAKGSRYTGTARDRLTVFAQERGWSEETLNDVVRLLVRTDG
jgi:hypothetical protein